MKRTRWARACRRSWWRRTGLPLRSAWVRMAAARPASARISGSSAVMASADSVGRIDWRQSAKSQHLFVREREWEAAQTVWFWRDSDPGMRFGSGDVTKMERANLLLLALASLLVRGGERVGLMGAAVSSRRVALHLIAHRPFPARSRHAGKGTRPRRTRCRPARRADRARIAHRLAQRFSSPRVEERMAGFARLGAVGHLVRIIDPAEEDFPYSGRARFESPRGHEQRLVRARRKRGPGLSRPLRRPWRKHRGAPRQAWAGASPHIAPTMRRRRR